MNFKFSFFFMFFIASSSFALEEMTDAGLADITGQNGVYVSGELIINENGGPLGLGDAGNSGVWGTCDEVAGATADRCGARLAVQPSENGGWIAMDDMQGGIAFEGMTIRSRVIDSASDDFGGDESEVGIDGMTVLEIGLPEKLTFDNFQYSIVTSSEGRPTDAGYQQQVRAGIDFNGSINLRGNLLVFPTGNP